MEPVYNLTYGTGLEGLINYSNLLVDGWFALLFLLFVWVASVYVLSKSEWKLPGVMAFSSALTLFLAWILRTITIVGDRWILLLALATAGFTAWAVLENRQ